MYERRKLIKAMSKKPIYQILNTVKTFLFLFKLFINSFLLAYEIFFGNY